jgi:hypothetical protein
VERVGAFTSSRCLPASGSFVRVGNVLCAMRE